MAGEEDFQAAFWTAKRAMALASEAAYNRHGVRDGQQFILGCLWQQDGLTPGEIARRLALSTPTVTRATSRMEAAGLLRREAHEGDARLVRLRLTEKGRKLEAVMVEEMAALSERALSGLDERQRATLVLHLHTIRTNLTR